ncbi:tripartite tricarboxylate transporter substrate binding protein [Variovorax boronicumulans]
MLYMSSGFNRVRATLSTVLLFVAFATSAQTFPTQRIEFVVPNPPGGGTDVVGRAVAEAATKQLNQPVVVLNKPGASGSIGLSEAARAKPDGYKLAVLIPEVTWLASLGIGKVSQDDFIPLGQFTLDAASVTVRADAPWNSIEEFLADAKKRPNGMRIANSGNGGMWHLAAAALEETSGVKFMHVPYQGSAPAFMALLAAQVDATTVAPGEMTSHINAGKLKVLTVMSAQRMPGFKDVPTLTERGIKLTVAVARGVAAPKGTPEPIVSALRTALRKAAEDPVLRERIAAQSMNFHYVDGPEYAASLARDAQLFQPLVGRLKLN